MKKVFASLIMLFAFLCTLPTLTMAAANAQAAGQVKLIIEGKAVEPDVPPLLENGRTLVPIRVVAEEMGANVSWNQATRTATIERDQKQIVLQLGNTKAKKNNQEVALDVPPKLQDNRMLLPLRFVGEALDSLIGWDSGSRTVVVNGGPQVKVNGKWMDPQPKSFKMDGTLYVAADPVAESFGLKQKLANTPATSIKTIDSTSYMSVEQLAKLIDGEIDWNPDDNQVTIERANEFTGFSLDGDKLIVKTAKPVSPNHFTMDSPRRIVLDLPQTTLSEKMKDALQQAEKLAVSGKAQDAATDEQDTAGAPENLIEALDDPGSEQELSPPSEEKPLVTDIRYSQYQSSPDTVRVVLELSRKSKYTITEIADGFEVALAPVPLKTGYLIVIDAGHGGKDQGAKGIAGNLEKDFNLAVANRVVELLKQYPKFQVIATRSTDVYLTLQERVDIANEADADLFLSIHANSFTPTSRGTETFYYNANSKDLATIVHRHLVGATQFPDRKVQTQPFYVIKYTKMPAVLTETGFLTNEMENKQLVSPEFQDKVAKALVAAIREYYENGF